LTTGVVSRRTRRYQIIENAIELSLLDLQQIKATGTSNDLRGKTVGNALFSPFVLEYGLWIRRYGNYSAPFAGACSDDQAK